MMSASILAKKNERLASLRTVKAELDVQIIELNRLDAPEKATQAASRQQSAVRLMQMIATNVSNRLAALADTAHEADQGKRRFQVETGIFRDLKRPDALMSSFLVMLGWLVETIFTTVSLFADGHHDLILAMGFAATFSTVNVGLGLCAGACLRYVGYRADSPVERPKEVRISKIALAGFLSVLVVDAVMIFVGGRVRVSGNHHSIFDFSEVSLGATFGDGLALIVMVAAALSFAISAYKGYQGFTDPDPDYADYAGRTAAESNEDAEDIVQSALDQIEDIFEDAESPVLDDQEARDDQLALAEDVLRFNADVEDAKGELEVFAQAEWNRQSFIEGTEVERPYLDIRDFETLLIDPDTVCLPPAPQDIPLDPLRQAHVEATASITTAFAEYMSAVQGFRVLPPNPSPTKRR